MSSMVSHPTWVHRLAIHVCVTDYVPLAGLDLLSTMKVTQSCPTLHDPMDYTVHGILQARILECVAIPFSRGSSQPRSPALQADSLPSEPPGKPPQYYAAAAAAKSLQSCLTLCDPHGQQPTRLLCPRDSPGKNTGVGCHFLLHLSTVRQWNTLFYLSSQHYRLLYRNQNFANSL